MDKELWLRYSCGNMRPASMQVANHPVADGRWHDVSLEVNGTTLRLTIDSSHSNSVVLPQPCKLTQSGGALVLASSDPNTDAERLGFTGCLESLHFNGEAVRGKEGVTGTGLQSGRLFGIYQCCSDVKICASNPCENGGTCEEDSSGGGKAVTLRGEYLQSLSTLFYLLSYKIRNANSVTKSVCHLHNLHFLLVYTTSFDMDDYNAASFNQHMMNYCHDH